MRLGPETNNKSVISELAEAISSFNIPVVTKLLSDDGSFSVINENNQVVRSDKVNFISWLNRVFRVAGNGVPLERKLEFNVVRCLHSVNGNQILLFENGRFPLFTEDQKHDEKSAFVIIAENGTVKAIDFCYLILKTEYPFIYEKRSLISPGD